MDNPRFYAVTEWNVVVKNRLKSLQDSDFYIRHEGLYAGESYVKDYHINDMDIRFLWEVNEKIDTTAVFTLSKPLCALGIYSKNILNTRSPRTGTLMVEFQITVNTEPQGLLNLMGYAAIFKALCDPKRGKSNWMGVGLAPRIIEESLPIEGGELSEKLKNRLLLQNVLVTFDKLEENVYGG